MAVQILQPFLFAAINVDYQLLSSLRLLQQKKFTIFASKLMLFLYANMKRIERHV